MRDSCCHPAFRSMRCQYSYCTQLHALTNATQLSWHIWHAGRSNANHPFEPPYDATYLPLCESQVHLSSSLGCKPLVLLQRATNDASRDGEVAVVTASSSDLLCVQARLHPQSAYAPMIMPSVYFCGSPEGAIERRHDHGKLRYEHCDVRKTGSFPRDSHFDCLRTEGEWC